MAKPKPAHDDPADISNISELERQAQIKARQADIVQVMVLGMTRNLGECFGITLLPVILGLFDAVLRLSKAMITEADVLGGDPAVGGTMILLRDKLKHVETELEKHRSKNTQGMAADTASRN